MTGLPAAAVTAAGDMLTRLKHSWIPATDAEKAADQATARKMLEAAAPHIAAAWRDGYGQGRDDEAAGLPLATGEAVFTGTADPTTENEGFRAWKAGRAAGRAEGAAAERERIRQLALRHSAICPRDPDAGISVTTGNAHVWMPGNDLPGIILFADLLADTP